MSAYPLYRWLLTIGILPLVVLCASGTKASASCGDYLHIVADKSQTPNGNTPNQPRPPCHGPSCHQAPVMPTPVPVTVTPTEHQSTDAILTTSAEVEALQTADIPDGEFPTFHTLAESIFHPPRCS